MFDPDQEHYSATQREGDKAQGRMKVKDKGTGNGEETKIEKCQARGEICVSRRPTPCLMWNFRLNTAMQYFR